MAFLLNPPTIAAEALAWQEIGDEADPKTRLLAHMRIGNVDLHVEAREVAQDEDGFQTTKDYPDDLDTMLSITDSRAYVTLEMHGRNYWLLIHPYEA